MAFAALTIDLNAQLAKFEQDMARASKSLDGLDRRASAVASGMKSSFAALGATLTVGAFVSFAKSTIDAADALNDMSGRTSVAVKDLASLKTAAEQNGTSLEAVAKGVQKITLSMSQAEGGNEEMAASLERLGVTSKAPREALFQLADAVASTNDPTQIAADLQKVLGKSYAELIPFLKQGAEELRKSAEASESFAEAMARAAPEADKFNDEMARLKTDAAGAAAVLLVDMMPVLKGMLVAVSGVGEAFYQVGSSIGAAAAAAVSAARGDFKQAAQIMTALFDDLEKRQTEFGKRMADILAPASKAAAGAGGGSSTGTGVGGGGKTAGSKSDPLAGLLASTDIGRMQEFNKTVALLNQRFAQGRISAEQHAQAMTKLVEATFANNFKEAANDAEFFRMVEEDGIKTTQEWAQNLRDLANVDMSRLNDLLANTDFARLAEDQADMILLAKAFTDGIKDADGNLRKLSEAEYLDAVKNRLGLIGEEAQKTKSLSEELGLVFESAFEKAIDGGGSFQDILKGLLADIIKVIARTQILIPLLEKINGKSSLSGGSGSGISFDIGGLFSEGFGNGQNLLGDFASLFGFANGGIMTPAGPVPLRKYAGGGIASTPQLALFGEGSRSEAFVPLEDGRRIPVRMQGGGGQVINNITIKTDDPAKVRASRGQLLADISNQMQRASRWN